MIVAKSPKTAWQIIEGEAVLLSMDTKVLRGLNPVGSRIWELIDGQRSLEEITGMIIQEFEVAPGVAAQDVQAFIQTLLDRGLVTRLP
ncbi:MAG: PqqD family protein [Candidatus Methylomirabilota bacterium]